MPYSIIGDIGQMEMLNGCTCQRGNPCVILTLDNILQFCDNIIRPEGFDGNLPMAKLPDSFLPLNKTILSCIGSNTKDVSKRFAAFILDENGYIYFEGNTLKVHCNGLLISCAGNWYTNELGNNKAQGTSPLTEV